MRQMNAYSTAEALPASPVSHTAALSPGIRAAVSYIEMNYAAPITLAELSRMAGLSLHRFVTVFRAQVGIPPHQFVCRTRIGQARALLRQGLPPAAVAVDTGFCDQSHLSRHFKRFCGTTPGSYLNSLGQEAA
jgi:transcriptional regulator GlxA family with amidase domain